MRAGWQTKNLGDVCEVIGGGTPSKDNPAYYLGEIPWATVRDMRQEVITETECQITKEAVKSSATNIIPSGNVVIATRVGLGKVCLLGQDTAINQDLRGIIPRNPNVLLVRFLFWWFKSIADVIVAEGTGATVQGVKLPFVKSLPLPVPPLSEQHRIVAILDEAFDGIATAKANTEKNLQNARALFDSHLQSVFTERGEGWVEPAKQLSELCELIVDCEHKTAPIQKVGFPSIRTTNIGKGKLLLDGVNRVSQETYDAWTRRAIPQPGDLIFAREAPAGNVAVIPNGLKVCLGQRTVLIRSKMAVFDSDFLASLLLTPQMQQRLVAHSKGATVKHINMKDIRALDVGAIPSLDVQRVLARIMSDVSNERERLETIYQQKLTALDNLKKSLLHQAFSGQL
ncbi:MAG: restriction endonuclease subunit S [Gammaproteobacteria bacterium]|nr:restriction endonuclease subunit S [Gammaproteobacteria bacterium]MBK7731023.1 restriction endonuclease subunit S [Gammaproteobacteria bacterium]MBP6229179.1 restriction endonuclease subunit S [Pseudomonadales bacterium]